MSLKVVVFIDTSCRSICNREQLHYRYILIIYVSITSVILTVIVLEVIIQGGNISGNSSSIDVMKEAAVDCLYEDLSNAEAEPGSVGGMIVVVVVVVLQFFY